MNDTPKALTSALAAITSWVSWISLEHIGATLACIASLIAILAGLPVAIDRWRHKLPAAITRHFPARPLAS